MELHWHCTLINLKVKNVGGRTKRNTLSGGILRVASYLGNQDIAVR